MRLNSFVAAVLTVTPVGALADTFTLEAQPTAVTIYPGVASVSRDVSIDLPAGNHTIVVPNLPAQLRADFVEVKTDDAVTVGAINLATGRLPATPDAPSEAMIAAQAEVDRLTDVLRQSDVAIAEIRLKAQAAEEQIAFLRGMTAQTTDLDDVGAVQALADMVGAEILVLRERAFNAEQDALAAERAQKDDREALADALQTLAAVSAPDSDSATLTFLVDVAEDATVAFDISSIEGNATWEPVYDLRLTTGETPTLVIERHVVVSQFSGQDWTDVDLILSTAQPSGRVSPYRANGQLNRIISEEEYLAQLDAGTGKIGTLFGAGIAPETPAPAAVTLSRRAPDGIATSYDYPRTVTLRNGVEDLRLPLDELTFDANQRARAVPAKENAAYRMVKFTNGNDILLQGEARFFANDVLVGFDRLRQVAAGQSVEIGFGAIQGLLTKRTAPNRSEGAVGLIAQENQRAETVTLTLENLTQEDWQIQVREGVPYSEQTDLEVSYTATPEHTMFTGGGRQGVMQWIIDLPVGETQDITVDYTLNWPEGFRLEE